MAKVMVSLPDDLLTSLDAEAARRGTSRSGLLRDYVDAGIRDRAQQRARRIRQVTRDARPHGGYGLEELKARRPSA